MVAALLFNPEVQGETGSHIAREISLFFFVSDPVLLPFSLPVSIPQPLDFILHSTPTPAKFLFTLSSQSRLLSTLITPAYK